AKGKYVIPGLWDLHEHYRDWMPELFLHYGITTVQDAGNPTDWILAIRDAVAKGRIPGPRMFVCGDAIGAPKELVDATHERRYVKDPEDARRVAREMIAKGVDCLKTWTYITPEEAKAVTEETTRAGIRRMGHAVNDNAITTADVGIQQLPHMGGIAVAAFKDPALIKKYEDAYTAN